MKINTDDLYYAIEEAGSKSSELEYALSELENALMRIQNECWSKGVDIVEYVNSDEAELKQVIKTSKNQLSQFNLEGVLWFSEKEEAGE